MRILIFEWLSGGGLFCDGATPDADCPFVKQGRLMLEAVADDFHRAGHQPVVLRDPRVTAALPPTAHVEPFDSSIESRTHLQRELYRIAGECDHVLLIAPECGGRLLDCVDWLQEHQDRLLSPDARFVELTSNKSATADWLTERGVRVPASLPNLSNKFQRADFLPAVIKPVDGAGSEGVEFVTSFEELTNTLSQLETTDRLRIEQYVAGTPVSVSVIAHSDGFELLPPTGQTFDAVPIGSYTGAIYPLPPDVAARANDLATAAVTALPDTRGYFGIDLVVADEGSAHDVVIEVNPRLTTSYVTLREIVDQNLAAAAMMESGISHG